VFLKLKTKAAITNTICRLQSHVDCMPLSDDCMPHVVKSRSLEEVPVTHGASQPDLGH